MRIIIVGGVAGGATAAARLRRLNENAEIIMVEKGEYISFANCGLPYYIGGEIKDKSALTLQTPQSFNKRFNVDVRVSSKVVSIDREKKTVTIESACGSYVESYDKLVLSMGAEPIKPPIDGIDSDKIFTLRNIPDTFKIKDYIDHSGAKTVAVVGGGYIGVEMAENLVAAGLKVTLIEMSNQVIAPLDYDMACDVHNHMRAKGLDLRLNKGLKRAQDNGGGLNLTLTDDSNVAVDMAILAIGVKPENALAKQSGLQCGERGGIVVDEHMLTSDKDIYAVGDVVEVVDYVSGIKSMIPLASPANKQGRIAADNICGIKSAYGGTQGSAILKVFDMAVASTGINEKTAQKLNLNYEKSFTYSGSHAGYYPGANNMSIKVIFDKKDGRILGAQVVGYDGVDKRCDVLATAIRAKMTASDLSKLELCYAPPFSSAKDPVNMAGYVIDNILSGNVEVFHWHDVAKVKELKDVVLLDTRTKLEYESGNIEGFINIPLDELRSRLGELDKAKIIYVHCQSGLRSYIACRILMQNGYDCYNLSGGYRLYNSIFKKVETIMDNKQNNNKVINLQEVKRVQIDACGLQCPGPIVKLAKAMGEANDGEIIEISTTDPAFADDIAGYCRRTGNVFLGMDSAKGESKAIIKKGCEAIACSVNNNKNIIVFSGDLDRAIASFIIANAAAALGRHVEMFFTFWGLNVLRKPKKVKVKKSFIEKMFGFMMPRGSEKLSLSKMNMGGIGGKMIRGIMKKKNVDSLEDLIKSAVEAGVVLVACSMSMDVMGIKAEELIDGVKLGGAAAMLANAEESDMSLFI